MLSNRKLDEYYSCPPEYVAMGALSEVVLYGTKTYFEKIYDQNTKSVEDVRHELKQATTYLIGICNNYRKSEHKSAKYNNMSRESKPDRPVEIPPPFLRNLEELTPLQIAYAIIYCYEVCQIPCAGESGDADQDLLGVYKSDGDCSGLYVTQDKEINDLIQSIKPGASSRDSVEVKRILRNLAKRKERCQDRDLIPVNNGVFDYEAKKLIPYSSEYVFLAKSRVNYNPQARNVVIQNPDGTTWDVDSWMASLSDDPEIVALLWQVVGAVIRPFVRWNKCVMMYSTLGENGKGTLCELMRNLCGEGRHGSIKVADFAGSFMLEKLPEFMAIISDENDVGSYLDKAGNFKAVITNDVIQINRKNKPAIPFQFFGLVIQCINELPKVKDKSGSLYRRFLIIPFSKCFTGKARTYIKEDYLKRPEVLEYVMYKVLHTTYYEFSEPAACRLALEDYKVYNDPVRQWWDEVSGELVWDLLPWDFLYELYKQWCKDNNPSGKMTSKRGFMDQMREVADKDAIWECPYTVDKDGRKKDKQISASGRITCDEPLAASVGYRLGDMSRWQSVYRGLLRRVPTPQAQKQAQKQTMAVSVLENALTVSYADVCGPQTRNLAS